MLTPTTLIVNDLITRELERLRRVRAELASQRVVTLNRLANQAYAFVELA